MTELATLDGPQFLRLLDKTYYTKAHEDDHGFDRVEAKMVERWKESELSGDEYRWTLTATAYRKGQPIAREGGYSLADALTRLMPRLYQIESSGYLSIFECAQPACERPATVLYRLDREYARGGHELAHQPANKVRGFCARHTHRGDCGLEDNDRNYQALAWLVGDEWSVVPAVVSE
jgi:hypothetical protein